MILESAIVIFYILIPAFLPNNIAVIAGGGRPVDGNKKWRENRILGDGKTWRGTIIGALGGLLAGLILNGIQPLLVEFYSFPIFSASALIGLSAGAMIGDIIASFIKRRLDKERGSAFPGLDQLDFLIGAFTLSYIMDSSWLMASISKEMILIAFIITPILHISTNRIGYKLGFKEEPW